MAETRPAGDDYSDEIIIDGTSFEFWMRDADGERRGSTYGPSSGSAAAAASIATELIAFCHGKLSERKIAAED